MSRTATQGVIRLLANVSICVSVSLVSPYHTEAEDVNFDDPLIPRLGRSEAIAHPVNESHQSNTDNGQHFPRLTKHYLKLLINNILLHYQKKMFITTPTPIDTEPRR